MGVLMKTAMIIDDDEDLGELLSMMLASRRIQAIAIHTLTEAEACLEIMKPNLIFLDNSFPDGLGINFIRTIRSADEEIKIIMITADTEQWIEQKARDEGIDFFLKKPITRQTIERALDQINFAKA